MRTRFIFVLLCFIFLAPFGYAHYLQNQAKQGLLGHTNKGMLISPVKKSESLNFIALNQQAPIKLLGKWHLVYIPPIHCEQRCHERIHMTGQIHHALHKNASRLERMLVLLDQHNQADFSAYDKKYYLKNEDYKIINPNLQIQQGAYYVIDPNANIMMSFSGDAPYKDILKDLSKLLKLSKIGYTRST